MSIGVLVDVCLHPGGVELWLPTFEARFRISRQAKAVRISTGVNRNDPDHLVLVEKWSSVEAHSRNRERIVSEPVLQEAHSFLEEDLRHTFIDDLEI